MRECCTSGSVRGGDGNIPTYSAPKAACRPGARLGGFGFAVAGRGIADKRVEQLVRRSRDVVHGAVEGGFVGFRWPREAAQLANELHCGGADLVVGRRRLEVVQGFDASAHDWNS
jgi:hypothetical protein